MIKNNLPTPFLQAKDLTTVRLTVPGISALSDEMAISVIERFRWPNGVSCPKCCAMGAKRMADKRPYRCPKCRNEFTHLSGSVFSSSKLSAKGVLLFVAAFVSHPKGISSTQMATNFGCQQITAYKLMDKIREGIFNSLQFITLSGEVEVDGAIFGGHRRHENITRDGRSYRITRANMKNRRVVVIARQRGGRSIPFIVSKESEALPQLRGHISDGSVIHADGAHAWDSLNELYDMMRIEHKYAFKMNGACTNLAESYYAMLRRAHLGVYHHFSAEKLHLYAAEMAWRLDHNKLSLGQKISSLISGTFFLNDKKLQISGVMQ